MTELVVRDLVVRFGKVLALDGLSLTVGRGERVSLIGPNGAGKSTTVQAVAGTHRPAGGTVTFDGEDVTGCDPAALVRRGITLAPQGRRLFGSMTVRENLEMGAYLVRDRRRIADDIDRWIDFFPELRPKVDARASSLSGGQQQMVALARALMPGPRLLMLDEPSMGVAPAVVARIGEHLCRLNEELGLPILLVEQNIELAFAVAQRVVVLSQGRDVHTAPPDELRDPDVLSHHFFGPSPTVGRPSTPDGPDREAVTRARS